MDSGESDVKYSMLEEGVVADGGCLSEAPQRCEGCECVGFVAVSSKDEARHRTL